MCSTVIAVIITLLFRHGIRFPKTTILTWQLLIASRERNLQNFSSGRIYNFPYGHQTRKINLFFPPF
jgi:hypothetical protein